MLRRRLALGLPLIAALALTGCATPSMQRVVQCDSRDGVAHRWLWPPMGGDGGSGRVTGFAVGVDGTVSVSSTSGDGSLQGSISVGGPSGDDKLKPVADIDPRALVWASISSGWDPVDAARQFGPHTFADEARVPPLEMARAIDPATYGWFNCQTVEELPVDVPYVPAPGGPSGQ